MMGYVVYFAMSVNPCIWFVGVIKHLFVFLRRIHSVRAYVPSCFYCLGYYAKLTKHEPKALVLWSRQENLTSGTHLGWAHQDKGRINKS